MADDVTVRDRIDLGGNVFDCMGITEMISLLEDLRKRAVDEGMVSDDDGRIYIECDEYGCFADTYYVFDRRETDKEREVRLGKEVIAKAQKRAKKASKVAADRALYEKLKAKFG